MLFVRKMRVVEMIVMSIPFYFTYLTTGIDFERTYGLHLNVRTHTRNGFGIGSSCNAAHSPIQYLISIRIANAGYCSLLDFMCAS